MYLRNDDAGLPRHLFLWKKTISVIYFEFVFVALGMQSACRTICALSRCTVLFQVASLTAGISGGGGNAIENNLCLNYFFYFF